MNPAEVFAKSIRGTAAHAARAIDPGKPTATSRLEKAVTSHRTPRRSAYSRKRRYMILVAARMAFREYRPMLAKVCSAALTGVDAYPVEVEVNCGWGDTIV